MIIRDLAIARINSSEVDSTHWGDQLIAEATGEFAMLVRASSPGFDDHQRSGRATLEVRAT